MGDLPFLPGYSFNDCAVRHHKIKHKLNYSNGCRIVYDSNVGIERPAYSSSSTYAQEIPEQVVYDPTWTYGQAKNYPYRQVIPHYVLYAQKCLKFNAFFRQNVFDSPLEYHRVRHVNIIYFLEDNTMCVVEPPVDNAGLFQGRLVNRAKIPKNQDGKFYHWKDLNVGMDLAIYGIIYHTVDCDIFTKEFLQSQGIDVGDREEPPSDFYTQDRLAKASATHLASTVSKRSRALSQDSRRRFLDYDGIVLTFGAIWNNEFYQVMYFLTDDTMIVREIPGSNNGNNSHRVLLKRVKVPKNWNDMPNLERGNEDMVEYYTPTDLIIGQTISIFGRSFSLYDCDRFTKEYYSKMLNIEQPPKIFPVHLEPLSERRVCDKTRPRTSLQKIVPKTNDTLSNIFNHPNKLRYLASMIAIYPEDKGRDFVIEYNLSDGKIKINEIGKRNSGHRAGCFLASMLIPKLKKKTDGRSDDKDADDNIIYYTPEDFFIGAQISIFNHRFVIKGADLFVLRYIQVNSDKFSSHLNDNITNYFTKKKIIEEQNVDECHEKQKITGEPILPARPIATDSSMRTEDIVSNVFDAKTFDSNGKLKHLCVSSPRQITETDQVEIPCVLRQI